MEEDIFKNSKENIIVTKEEFKSHCRQTAKVVKVLDLTTGGIIPNETFTISSNIRTPRRSRYGR